MSVNPTNQPAGQREEWKGVTGGAGRRHPAQKPTVLQNGADSLNE